MNYRKTRITVKQFRHCKKEEHLKVLKECNKVLGYSFKANRVCEDISVSMLIHLFQPMCYLLSLLELV